MKALSLMKKLGIKIEGIIHVGANTGKECYDYVASGATCCLYIEPFSAAFRELENNIKRFPGHTAINAVCSDVGGQPVTLNIANNLGMSSSMFPLGTHAVIYPEIKYVGAESMVTRTLDEIVQTSAQGITFNLLVIDTQGAELKVLQGARSLISRIDGIFVEISEMPLYEGGCTSDEVISFLGGYEFKMKWMKIGKERIGDAFFLRSPKLICTNIGPNLALNMPATQSSFSIWSRTSDAQGGNNGCRNGRFGFHTDFEQNPWWQVDLGCPYPITEIRVFNRLDACSDRACRLQAMVSIDGNNWRLVHDQQGRRFGGVNDGRPLRIIPKDLSARFVRLQLNEYQCLHLDEIEIY